IAGGKIGESDTNSPANINTKAIVTQVGSIAARSGTGIYIQELDALSIESISNNVVQVNFRGNTTDRTQVLEDLTTTNNGPVKLQSLAGSITVNAGTTGTNGITAHGTGDILLQTLSNGTIVANAMIQSGSGNISLSSREALVLEDRIRTSGPGSIVLESQGSITLGATSTFTTNNANLGVFAGGDVRIGSINAGTGQVYLQASGDIKDSDSSANSTNVVASAAAMRAGGKIGNSDTGSSSGSINRNAIGTQVSGLAAQSATGIYIQETDGLTIDSVSVSSSQVNFNSTRTALSQVLEDLTTTNNGPVKLQSLAGSITVNAGTTGTNGITAHGTGDILLQTLSNGTIVANAMIQSGSGNISLSSREALVLEDRIRTSGPGSIVLESQGSITLGATSTFTTNNANLGVFAGGDVRIGSINAGTGSVLLASGGNISEINPSTTATQIVAQNLSMRASGRIGDSDLMNSTFDNNRNAIIINATNLAARASDSIYIQDKGVITVDRISTRLTQVEFNSTTTDRSEVIEDLSTTANNGNIKLQSLAGDITINAGTPGT
ncbi:MAG: beta strand repeat-containing protein, partial [Pirellula sp.]